MSLIKRMLLGHAVGDALGVPVEFMSRERLEAEPVTGMRGFGTHNQPAGTWSDDTSMTLVLLDSMMTKKGIDADDIMRRFAGWYRDGQYTPYGKVFDCGLSCSAAIRRYLMGTPAKECGGTGERDNGNGSLMRILPIVPYAIENTALAYEDIARETRLVSSLTHAHERSVAACILYVFIGMELAVGEGESLAERIKSGILIADQFITDNVERVKYSRILDEHIWLGDYDKDTIDSTGYVVDTLEAALWCLETTNSYKECVLQAVNLGSDTDTIAAIAGGLAAAYYGDECIPEEWLNTLAKREDLERAADLFDDWIKSN